jgi:hypothetical protein
MDYDEAKNGSAATRSRGPVNEREGADHQSLVWISSGAQIF